MPINQETLNAELFKLLKSNGYEPDMRSSSGELSGVPDEAEVFQFKFRKDGDDYGTVTVSIDGLTKLVVYYSKSVADSPKGSASGDMSWSDLRTLINKWRFSKGIRTFELKDESDLKYDMAKREHTKKLDEGYYPINKHSSYNDAVPNVKIKIMHTEALGENDQRFRKVARIYLENTEGERFLLDTKKPGIARVYARHLAEGGKVNDDRWGHIHSLVEDYSKMAGFVRATRNHQFNESTQQLISEGISHYSNLRETLQKLSGKKGYNTYFESYTPTLTEDHMDATELTERFMSSSLDPRIESAMPILAKLSKKISEMSEVQQLEEWSNSVVDESINTNTRPQIKKLARTLSNELIVGVDAVNAKETLGALGLQDDDLDFALERLALENPDADVSDDVLDWMADSRNHMFHEVVMNVRKTQQPAQPPAQPAPVQQQAPAQQAPAPQQQAPVQQESLRDGEHHTWTVHFDDGTSKKVNVSSDEFDVKSYYAKKGKKVTKVDKSYAIQGQQYDAPKRSSDDSGERADRDTKAHVQHDRSLTETEVEEGRRTNSEIQNEISERKELVTYIKKLLSPWGLGEDQARYSDLLRLHAPTYWKLWNKRVSYNDLMNTRKIPLELVKRTAKELEYVVELVDQEWNDNHPDWQPWPSVVRKREEVEEGLDKNQKAAGQLGPTDKVSTGKVLGRKLQNQKGLRGKLVGANESVDPLTRLRNLSGLDK